MTKVPTAVLSRLGSRIVTDSINNLNSGQIGTGGTPVAAFFSTFQAQHGGSPSPGRSRPRSAAAQQVVLTRERIKELYELHRRGKLVGPQWEQTEQQIIAAANEGRVAGAVEPLGR
jgi:hypothetical protein